MQIWYIGGGNAEGIKYLTLFKEIDITPRGSGVKDVFIKAEASLKQGTNLTPSPALMSATKGCERARAKLCTSSFIYTR